MVPATLFPFPAAGSVNVDVRFDLSHDGILTLDAKDRDIGSTMQQTIRVNVREA